MDSWETKAFCSQRKLQSRYHFRALERHFRSGWAWWHGLAIRSEGKGVKSSSSAHSDYGLGKKRKENSPAHVVAVIRGTVWVNLDSAGAFGCHHETHGFLGWKDGWLWPFCLLNHLDYDEKWEQENKWSKPLEIKSHAPLKHWKGGWTTL